MKRLLCICVLLMTTGCHVPPVVSSDAVAAAGVPAKRTSSTWVESASPDFYRIRGKANIDRKISRGKVSYGYYDRYRRVRSVAANLAYSNIVYGQRARANISSIHPTGWTSNRIVTLHFIDGSSYRGYFYNRSHLLAHSLGGADKKYNMITGTRPQNVGKNDFKGGMQYCEMLASDYLKSHRSASLYYIVTPIYKGREKVARSVIVDMRSSDKSINQEVEVYNTAPGYSINYRTGTYGAKLRKEIISHENKIL